MKYLYNLFKYFNNNLKLEYKLKIPIIYINNKGAKILAKNNIFYKRTKYIYLVYYYIQDVVKNKRVIFLKRRTHVAALLFLTGYLKMIEVKNMGF